VRNSVGVLDASTLGKIIVKGPDAAKFLDMMYTNMMSTLKPGKCRYGLMNNENGFLMDDGVVVRLDEETFLCHTTSGGADNIHGWFEEWLQTEWFDLKVYTANVTEQFTQIAVAGPQARELLNSLDSDIDFNALPFMSMAEGSVCMAKPKRWAAEPMGPRHSISCAQKKALSSSAMKPMGPSPRMMLACLGPCRRRKKTSSASARWSDLTLHVPIENSLLA
jgi:folate-binding Fe-S cluster repair protein YgfZ